MFVIDGYLRTTPGQAEWRRQLLDQLHEHYTASIASLLLSYHCVINVHLHLACAARSCRFSSPCLLCCPIINPSLSPFLEARVRQLDHFNLGIVRPVSRLLRMPGRLDLTHSKRTGNAENCACCPGEYPHHALMMLSFVLGPA